MRTKVAAEQAAKEAPYLASESNHSGESETDLSDDEAGPDSWMNLANYVRLHSGCSTDTNDHLPRNESDASSSDGSSEDESTIGAAKCKQLRAEQQLNVKTRIKGVVATSDLSDVFRLFNSLVDSDEHMHLRSEYNSYYKERNPGGGRTACQIEMAARAKLSKIASQYPSFSIAMPSKETLRNPVAAEAAIEYVQLSLSFAAWKQKNNKKWKIGARKALDARRERRRRNKLPRRLRDLRKTPVKA
jgi:hypothetical protein